MRKKSRSIKRVNHPKPAFKKFQVWWGNDDVCVDLSVTKSQWEKIARGDKVSIEGEQYPRGRCRKAKCVSSSATPTGPLVIRRPQKPFRISGWAPSLSVQASALSAGNAEEITRILEGFASQPGGGVIVLPNPITVAIANRGLIISLMDKYRLAAVYQFSYFVREGGLSRVSAALRVPLGRLCPSCSKTGAFLMSPISPLGREPQRFRNRCLAG
jgi:hypothetical protein